MNTILIIPYEDQYQKAFKSINEEWISQYFKMEAADYKALDHPNEYILDKGGHIFMALMDDEPVGACAMIKMDHPKYGFELAKMGVSPKAHGKGIGSQLANAIIQKSIDLGAKYIYLESNTVLGPAINLYRKIGFTEVSDEYTPYTRCNIQMELDLSKYQSK